MERVNIEIEGMGCGGCVAAVTRTLRELDGVRVESVVVGRAEVLVPAGGGAQEELLEALGREGYRARIGGGR